MVFYMSFLVNITFLPKFCILLKKYSLVIQLLRRNLILHCCHNGGNLAFIKVLDIVVTAFFKWNIRLLWVDATLPILGGRIMRFKDTLSRLPKKFPEVNIRARLMSRSPTPEQKVFFSIFFFFCSCQSSESRRKALTPLCSILHP